MLNAKQCDAFYAVAKTGSFDLAAEQLNITASAVTLRVQSLEKKLGQLLLVRDRPCRVTQSGQTLLHYLQHQRLLEQNLMQDLGGQLQHEGFYCLNIATNADSLATWLLPTLQAQLIQHKIVLHFQVDDQSQTHHLLEAGLVNACLSTEAKAMKGCRAELIGQMQYRLVATPKFSRNWFHQGVHRDALRLAPAIIFNEKDQLHTQFIQHEFGLNLAQYPHFFIPSTHAFFDAIVMGLGYGWLPDYQTRDLLESGELLELSSEMRIEVPLYWHHWKEQSSALEILGECLKQHAQTTMNQPITT